MSILKILQKNIFNNIFNNIKIEKNEHQNTWNDVVVENAMKYIGIKEKKGNKGWFNEKFEKSMRAIGFKTGHAWCAYFVERVWTDAAIIYNSKILTGIKKLFSGSTQKTYTNIEKKGDLYGFKIYNSPKVGDIIIWQRKDKPNLGHTGIVVSVLNENNIRVVEGNTNGVGSREGDGVYLKNRSVYGTKSLNVRGYIRFVEN